MLSTPCVIQVDPVYSVQFSNHTGYPTFRGPVFDGDQLQALAQGLEENKLLTHTHLLTGRLRCMPAAGLGALQPEPLIGRGPCVSMGSGGGLGFVPLVGCLRCLPGCVVARLCRGFRLTPDRMLPRGDAAGYIGSLSLLKAIADLCR